MKKAQLEKLEGKKIGGSAGGRGGHGEAQSRREQALARKRELLERQRKRK